MKKDWKYITYLGILGALLLVLMLSKSKQYDWTVTFHHEDKNPYGAYAFSQLFPTLTNHSITNSYQPLYELKDTLRDNENIFILSSTFSPGKQDTEVLLNHIENMAEERNIHFEQIEIAERDSFKSNISLHILKLIRQMSIKSKMKQYVDKALSVLKASIPATISMLGSSLIKF